MGLWNFLKLKPAKITNEEQLIYDISGAIIAISDITTDELYEHSKIIDKTHAFDMFFASEKCISLQQKI